ncbi:MAG: cysteine--tRNA ligase [Candidatus Hydrogenedentota bacterium]
MSIRIFNTLTGRIEEIHSLRNDKSIGMYVCGVTVYDYSHIGHARGAILFDVFRRFLIQEGFKVTYVRNITDIDDKIINRAISEKTPWDEIAKKYTEEYYKDMELLRVDKATIEPKATEHIPEMIEIVAGLLQKGYAYDSCGDIYFSIDKFPAYGKLSKKNLQELIAGARVEVSEKKRNPLDFVLWKYSKENEPSWDSPWGKGRPGWHIECSAMSMKYLGESFEIHCGGSDLIFPHHENEIAQSEAYTGKEFARYWVHNAFVTINKEKMSKSLGNFFTIREALKRWSPEAIRHFILKTKYSHPLNFSIEDLDASESAVMRLKDLKTRLDELNVCSTTKETAEIEEFYNSLKDDFNTGKAIGIMFELVSEINKCIEANNLKEIAEHRDTLYRMDDLFKIIPVIKDEITSEDVALIMEREQARERKDYKCADEIRLLLEKRGIYLKDTKSGTKWYKK